jgi:protein-disulfide isomerase
MTGSATPSPLSGTKPAATANARGAVLLAPLGFLVLLVGSFAYLSFGYLAKAGPQLQAAALQGHRPAHSASASPSAAPSAVAPKAAGAEPGPERQAADLKDGNLVWRIPVGDSPTRGPADAPVTIVELANYQCPFSRGVEPAMNKLLKDYAGKVRLVWKDDPLAVHAQAELAASVAREARAEQGDTGFWAAHDLMLAADFKPSDQSLREVGKKLSLDQSRLEHALTDHIYADPIARDAELADDFMAVGTPYLFVNGRRAVATGSLDQVRATIDEELAKVDGWAKQGVTSAHIYEHLMSDARGPLPLELKPFAFQSVVGPTRGALKSDALLAEFCDYKSYLCKLVDPLVDELLAKFPHDLGVTWIEPDHFTSDDSQRAAVAARAAYNLGGVDTFDKMRRLLFERQAQPMSAPALRGYAKSLGLAPTEFEKELQSSELFGAIEMEASLAKRSGIQEVPTFLVCGTDYCANGGYLLHGGQPRRAFEKRVRLVLAAAGHPLSATP